MIKIAVTGPHCCGKSTVLKKVSSILSENKKINFEKFDGSDSPVDYSSSEYLKNNNKAEIDITYWMIQKLIKREIDLEYSNKEIAVLDRCIIDQIVYPSELLSEEYTNDIFGFIKLWMKIHPYDIVFYIPQNNELLQKYGKKDKSSEYLKNIENRYFSVLEQLKINYIVLPKDQDEQVRIIADYLSNL
jgi:thymidylate kinase